MITALQPVLVTTSSVANSRETAHTFLESGGMLSLPPNNHAAAADPNHESGVGNTDSGLYPQPY